MNFTYLLYCKSRAIVLCIGLLRGRAEFNR